MEAVFSVADRITVMVNGAVIASGEPDAIRVNREVQQAYLGEEGEEGVATPVHAAPRREQAA
ncbi:ABC transporter ATP-binding protein C-terminal domain-containing protein [Cupriavidus basilensis]